MRKVFVGGLSWNTDEQGLRSAFSQAGEIEELKIITDRETGKSRGFGFVTFVSQESASAAIEKFNGNELDGRNIKVNFAEEKRRQRDFSSFKRGGNSSNNNSNSRW